MKDLNLLKVFEAIMSTGSVNEAAKKLHISSPAISQSLSKLRGIYSDPLFIRDGRGLKPSSFAKSLYKELEEPLSIIMNSASFNDDFEPLTSTRTFRIASSPDIDTLFFTKLLKKTKELAPNITIEMKAEERSEIKIHNLLRLRKVDLIVATVPINEGSYVDEIIGKLTPCIIHSENHPRIKDKITPEEYFNEEHCSWASKKDRNNLFYHTATKGMTDRRNIVYSSQSLFNLALISRDSDILSVCTTKHFEMIKYIGGIKSIEFPFDIDDVSIYSSWHRSFSKDKGLIWINKLLKEIMEE